MNINNIYIYILYKYIWLVGARMGPSQVFVVVFRGSLVLLLRTPRATWRCCSFWPTMRTGAAEQKEDDLTGLKSSGTNAIYWITHRSHINKHTAWWSLLFFARTWFVLCLFCLLMVMRRLSGRLWLASDFGGTLERLRCCRSYFYLEHFTWMIWEEMSEMAGKVVVPKIKYSMYTVDVDIL